MTTMQNHPLDPKILQIHIEEKAMKNQEQNMKPYRQIILLGFVLSLTLVTYGCSAKHPQYEDMIPTSEKDIMYKTFEITDLPYEMQKSLKYPPVPPDYPKILAEVIWWYPDSDPNSFHILLLLENQHFMYWHYYPYWRIGETYGVRLTDDELQTVIDLFKEVENIDTVESDGSYIVGVHSFVAEDVIAICSETSCSQPIQKLFEITDMVYKRESPKYSGLPDNPFASKE